MEEMELRSLLADAGLLLLEVDDRSEPRIPPFLATFANSCSDEDGAFGDAIPMSGANFLKDANSAWYRLGVSGAVFVENDPVFMVAVKFVSNEILRWRWVRVRLGREWDIIGRGAASLVLGNGPCRPAFVMTSLDGQAILRCDVGQGFIEFSVVPKACGAKTLLWHGERMLRSSSLDEETRMEVERWLKECRRRRI
ncbi:hypothetical protein [Kitasatospora sp. NPDC004272]